jgi:hypothetical protein
VASPRFIVEEGVILNGNCRIVGGRAAAQQAQHKGAAVQAEASSPPAQQSLVAASTSHG